MLRKIVPSFNKNTSMSLLALGGLLVPIIVFLIPVIKSATNTSAPASTTPADDGLNDPRLPTVAPEPVDTAGAPIVVPSSIN